jgi:tetratricopeptide (TPR) repeat protein
LAAKSSQHDPLLSAFISHAKADEKKADAIAKALESKGFKCWIAPRDVKPGRSYGDEIIRGIESCRSFVLVLSKASNDSAFVAREVERAVSKNKPIFAVRIADVKPSPSLELFISGTQWIDAFPGRLAPHVDRLAKMLAEDEGRNLTAQSAAFEPGAEPRPRPQWVLPVGVAVGVLLVLGTGITLWQRQEPTARTEQSDNPLDTKPVWFPKPDTTPQQQTAAAAQPADDEMIVGGKRVPEQHGQSAASLGLAGRDTDYQSCETAPGDEGLAACDRAIASGKFNGRNLSLLYSDRGFLRMQKQQLDLALADLNEAARIDSSNFYAYWSRGAVFVAKKDFDRARADLTTALSLNPDKDSKAKIEEALNAVQASDQPNPSDDKTVITDPSRFWGQDQEGSASAASSYPAEAMPAAPAEAYPASPPMDAADSPPRE